ILKVNCIQLYNQVQNQRVENPIAISGEDWMHIKDSPLGELKAFLPEQFCKKTSALLQLPLSELVEQLINLFNLNSNTGNLPYLFAFRDCVASFTSQGDKGVDAFLEWWD